MLSYRPIVFIIKLKSFLTKGEKFKLIKTIHYTAKSRETPVTSINVHMDYTLHNNKSFRYNLKII